MVLAYHKSDFSKVPAEDKVIADLGKLQIPPEDYAIPCPDSSLEMRSPEFQEKYIRFFLDGYGPDGLLANGLGDTL